LNRNSASTSTAIALSPNYNYPNTKQNQRINLVKKRS
jgi:hypothetical protein